MRVRLAEIEELPVLSAIMDAAIAELQRGFLSPAEIEASRAVMGLDTQLVRDRTYFVAEIEREIAGCGGWSRRATLYGGDHSGALRNDAVLDPAREPARVRAMYTKPGYARRGIGRAILEASEAAARAEGFAQTELMATLSGEPLYKACGYREVERVFAAPSADGVRVPLVRMIKPLV